MENSLKDQINSVLSILLSSVNNTTKEYINEQITKEEKKKFIKTDLSIASMRLENIISNYNRGIWKLNV